MVARHAHDSLAGDRRQLLLDGGVLVGIAVVGQVACDDYEVGLGGVDLADRRVEEILAVAGAADVEVRELRDSHGAERSLPR